MIDLILNSENYFSAEQPNHSTQEGWMNYRTTTRLQVETDADAYTITTCVPGVHVDSLEITWENDYLIITGQLRGDARGQAKVGRYVRHVPLQQPVLVEALQFAALPNGQLVIKLPFAVLYQSASAALKS